MGSGRKPQARPPGVVLGMDGRRLDYEPLLGQAPAAVSDQALEVPPAELTRGQRQFWRQAAPLAVGQGTLTASTAVGFRELCEQFCLKAAIARKIEKLGPASKSADAYIKAYVKLAQRLDATLARFKLTAFGKPADQAASRRSAAAASPWAEVAR